MHARIGILHVHPDHFERLLRILRERVLPAAQRQPGFSSFVVTANRKEGKVVSISFWETERDMLASEAGEHLRDPSPFFVYDLIVYHLNRKTPGGAET